MSDDTRYPCCKHCDVDPATGLDGYDDHHKRPCVVSTCPGMVPVGPTKEGKQ